jgi:hypothetical protein
VNVARFVNFEHVLELGVTADVSGVGQCLAKYKIEMNAASFDQTEVVRFAKVGCQVEAVKCIAINEYSRVMSISSSLNAFPVSVNRPM